MSEWAEVKLVMELNESYRRVWPFGVRLPPSLENSCGAFGQLSSTPFAQDFFSNILNFGLVTLETLNSVSQGEEVLMAASYCWHYSYIILIPDSLNVQEFLIYRGRSA